MRKEKLISVIVPVYNVEPYIHQCIKSLLRQTYDNLQIILVDDGSTDKSGEICDEYERLDERVMVIHQKNKGLSGARNEGLKYIQGDWVSFIDSDDWIEDDMYQVMLHALENVDNADIALCYFFEYHADDSVCETTLSKNISILDRNQLLYEYCSLESKYKITESVWDRLYKRELVENIRFPEGRINEDIAYTIDVFCRVNYAVYVDAPLYHYRVNRLGGITASKYTKSRIEDILYLAHEGEMILKKNNYLSELYMWKIKYSSCILNAVPENEEAKKVIRAYRNRNRIQIILNILKADISIRKKVLYISEAISCKLNRILVCVYNGCKR